MSFRKGFVADERARIPFSVIGIFLIIGSSFTTVYVANLETENSFKIANSINSSEIESCIRYVEADLARSLNYAACEAFEEIGKNPAIKGYEETPYNIDLDADGSVSYIEANLNAARHLTQSRFNKHITTNFMKNRCTFNDYIINVCDSISNWQDIDVRIITMDLERALNRGIQEPKKTYNVYPVLTTKLNIEVTRKDDNEKIFTRQVNVSTIINSRYLLLEDITKDFEERLSGSFGALGVDVLAGAMGLTWLRGYSQYFLSTPNNIISNEWLEILTNSGILLEEGFVYNTADPIGMVYVGYKTSKAVANELGYDLGSESEELKNSIDEPADNSNFEDIYKEQFNEMIEESEMGEMIDSNLDNVSTEFTAECNIKNICQQELNNLLKSDNIVDAIKNTYNALIKILTERTQISDNYEQIQNVMNDEKVNSKNIEENRKEDAESTVELPDGWHIISSRLVSSTYYEESHSVGNWEITDKSLKSSGDVFFDNSDKNFVTLDGEKWNIKKGRDVFYDWKIKTTWKIYAGNETESGDFTAILESTKYSYDASQEKIEDVTIKFVSDDYSNGISEIGGNNIKNSFKAIDFSGSELRDDPNLDGALENYKYGINWGDLIREDIFGNNNGKYSDGSYNDEFLAESESNSENMFHKQWLDSEILFSLGKTKEKLEENVTAEAIIDEGALPDEVVGDMTNKLLTAYHVYRAEILDEFQKEFKEGFLFKSSAAKTIYHINSIFVDAVGKRLNDENDESKGDIKEATDNAISESGEGTDSSYNSISKDMNDAKLLGNVAIPIGYTLKLKKDGNGYEYWDEEISFAIRQNPPFFCEEYFKDPPFGEEIFDNYIKYRNTNIFSPLAGATELIEDGFEAINSQILNSIDSGFENLKNIHNDTLRKEVENGLNYVAGEVFSSVASTLPEAINEELPTYLASRDLLSSAEVDRTVHDVLDSYDSYQELSHGLGVEEVSNKIISNLQDKVTNNVIARYGSNYDGIDDIIDSAKESVTSQVMSAYDKGISKGLDLVKDKIKSEYEKLSKKLEKNIEKKVAASLGKAIPAGLPILPPFGWWCTINAWYIEVEGEIPDFKVVDCSNEAIANPILGHNSQEYRRKNDEVKIDIDGDGFKETLIGRNTAIKFGFNTGTFIIVPPGKTGVGDKSGGMDELKEYGKK